MSPVLSYQYYDSLGADTNSVIMSPVASYQFYDSLEHLDTNSVITSPVASYQYFDWPEAGSVQFLNSLPVSYFYGTVGTVGHVQATQRPGTALVDLFYDLSGTGSDYYVSVAVSSDGGATFTVPATHFTGDGVTIPAAPAANHHIVWDAGVDFPGQFSTQMRVTVVAGSASALSPIFTLDTRPVTTGTLTGLVQGNGAPVANAQVRIDGTGFAASTGADGRFTLANVPAASGYLLTVTAAGYASKQKPGVTVSTGTSDVGIIQLTPLSGPYRLVPLQPDVNPLVTRIQEGGVGYRYYRLVPVSANDNPGGVTVTLQIAGGITIQQDGDMNASWAGFEAGKADRDGIVRLRIPADKIGSPGASATLEVLESGIVKATFPAQVVARQYEQVWKHEWEGELGLELGLGANIQAATRQAHETTVARGFGGAEPSREIVGRTRDDEFKLEVPLGYSARVGWIGGGAVAGLGGVVKASFGTSFYFSPDTADPTDNLMKLYAAFADDLDLVPMGGWIVGMVQQEIERNFLANQLESTTAAIRAAGYVKASAGFGRVVPWAEDLAVYNWANLSTDVGLEVGVEDHPGRYVDYYAELAGNLLGTIDSKTPAGTAVHIFMQPGGAVRGTVRHDPGGQTPQQLILESKLSLTTDIAQSVPGWPYNDLIQLLPLETAEYQYRYTLSFPGWGDIPGVAQSAWDSVRSRGQDRGQGSIFTVGQPLAWLSGILAAGTTVGYENRVYSADVVRANLPPIDLPDVIQFQLQGQVERGAELTKESGVLWQGLRMALEKYSDFPRQYYPSENIFDLERRWAGYALGPLNSYLSRAEAFVASLGDTVVQVGGGAAHAVLQIGQGVMAGASEIVTMWVPGLASPGGGQFAGEYGPRGFESKDGGTATNLVYGIGGIYRFESTSDFNGAGTLTIAYSPTEVVGLSPADLRIYELPDGTNRWQLVGGTVDVASNTVTATITNLGTYAVAPPLPTGDLQLTPSTNTLAADGVSEMTIVVTNIFLNTGEALVPPPYVGDYSGSATQQWTFTATAVGVSILNQDVDTNAPGVQVLSTNGTVTLFLRAPVGGTVARVSLASVAGDAFGSTAINLLDNAPPATPTGVSVTAGQSRIWISWQTNSEPDIAGYRVYYRLGASGPAWDGTAAVEGTPSPVMVTGTNYLLRGLALGRDYFVAVSAVDTTGNESPLSTPAQVTTAEAPPAPPTAAVARFGPDGTNILMWGLSEDDGYNDRDVARYDVLRAVLPGGDFAKVGEVGAGIGLYSETNILVGPAQYVRYAVVAVAGNGLTSAQTLGNRLIAGGNVFDNDGDGIADWWTTQYFGHPVAEESDQSLAQDDPDQDGLTNLQEHQLGRNPLVADNAWQMGGSVRTPGGAGVGGVVLDGLPGTPATGIDGSYSATFTYGWSGISAPSRTDDDPPANGVTTLDIALIRRQILGLAPLGSPYKVLAADVNGSGTVTTLDIAFMRQVILGLTNCFPAGVWRFVPSDYVFPDASNPWSAPTNRWHTNLLADVTGQDFVAIKLGDVNNSWVNPQNGLAAASKATAKGDGGSAGSPSVRFQASRHVVQPGETVRARVSVGGFAQVTSGQFTLAWDPTVLRYVGVGDFGLAGLSEGNLGTALAASGKLTFSWDDPQGVGVTVADGTSLFTVTFEAIGPVGSVSALALGDLPTVREATVNLAVAPFESQNGQVAVMGTPWVRVNVLDDWHGVFRLSVPTAPGLRYVLEFTDSLSGTPWTVLSAITGDGNLQILADPSATNQQRFYRVRVE